MAISAFHLFKIGHHSSALAISHGNQSRFAGELTSL
jgi:hypothetical protein